MKRAILVGLAMVCLIIYLVLLNGESVDFRLTTHWTVHWNVGALIGSAFVTGVLLALAVFAVQATRRAFVEWRTGRLQRRSSRIDQWEESGEELIWNGDAQRGRALLQKAWQRRPESSYAVLALAESFRDTGELHRARGVLYDAAGQQHTNPDVLFALAETHRAAGEIGPSIEALERLRALHPRAPRVLRALRDAYAQTERWHDAVGAHEVLIAEIREPQQVTRERETGVMLRYQAALQLKDSDKKVEALEALAASRTPPLPVVVSLGDALANAGRADDASAVWERALRSNPRTVLVERLTKLASETRHRDRLRALLRKTRPQQVVADNLHWTIAQLWLQDHNAEEAQREIQAIQQPETVGAAYHWLQAEVHRQRGQIEQAVAAYAKAAGNPDGYHCATCRHAEPQWMGRCPQCQGWDTYRATVEIAA
ncbi:MAG TPA: tetratricopeptide repeat protein [Candidatus Acidoferrales bacterium]|nr:tetratricopeptide repeat protein [Candidatus Acidoferrales bacterium]